MSYSHLVVVLVKPLHSDVIKNNIDNIIKSYKNLGYVNIKFIGKYKLCYNILGFNYSYIYIIYLTIYKKILSNCGRINNIIIMRILCIRWSGTYLLNLNWLIYSNSMYKYMIDNCFVKTFINNNICLKVQRYYSRLIKYKKILSLIRYKI